MPALRLSIFEPMPGKQAEVERLLDSLEAVLSKYPGYVMGGRFSAADRPEEVGRLGIWQEHTQADRAATDDDVIALRSQIHQIVKTGHMERLYDVAGESALSRATAG